MSRPNEYVLTTLAEQLPTRLNAARHNSLDCIRLTIAEAQAVRALLPRELESLEERVQRQRREAR